MRLTLSGSLRLAFLSLTQYSSLSQHTTVAARQLRDTARLSHCHCAVSHCTDCETDCETDFETELTSRLTARLTADCETDCDDCEIRDSTATARLRLPLSLRRCESLRLRQTPCARLVRLTKLVFEVFEVTHEVTPRER